MRIEYVTGRRPELFTRQLPAGLYNLAGAMYLAKLLAEELVGCGAVTSCVAAVYDDDGELRAKVEAKHDPDAVVQSRPPGQRRCAECLETVSTETPAKECPACGSRWLFNDSVLGADVVYQARE